MALYIFVTDFFIPYILIFTKKGISIIY